MDIIAFSHLTVTLDHTLVTSVLSFSAAIPTVHGKRKRCRGQRSRRRAAIVTVRLVRRLLRHEITPCYETLYTGGAQGPPEASNVRGIDDGGPCANANGTERG